MSRLLKCPVCWQPCEHTHGYLHEHEVTVTRGEIRVGSRLCDGSNSRPDVPLKTVRYSGNCPACGEFNVVEEQESYPGSNMSYGGLRIVECDINSCNTPVLLTDQHVIAERDDSLVEDTP